MHYDLLFTMHMHCDLLFTMHMHCDLLFTIFNNAVTYNAHALWFIVYYI